MVLTSNNTRDLSAALKRRCLHLFLEYPDAERELEIIRSKDTGLTDALAAQLVDVCAGCASWSCAGPRRSRRRSTGHVRSPCLASMELTAKVLAGTA